METMDSTSSPAPALLACKARTKVTPKTKQELASMYFPFISQHSAVNQLSIWMKGCPGLQESLAKTGYKHRNRLLTGQQVALVYEYLGEP